MASNPLSGILSGSAGGSGSGGRMNMTWGNLTGHERSVAWGQVNDVFMQILGRQATMAEAQKAYDTGISNYALGQRLMMSKEFTHTANFAQLRRSYAYELQQFVGANFKLTNKLAQSFAAHNYSTTDLQAWVYAHPHVYVHSNDFQSRVSQMKDVYSSVFGLDPALGDYGQHQVRARVDTNKKVPGVQGNKFVMQNVANDPLLGHIQQAALHFQTPDQYRAWLMNTAQYKQHAMTAVKPNAPADAGLTLNAQGRPVQQALAGRNPAAPDVAQ